MEKEIGNAGYDLQCQTEGVMGLIVRQAMIAHTARKGCEWKPGAFEDITNLPSFKASTEAVRTLPAFVQLGKDMEVFEKQCANAT